MLISLPIWWVVDNFDSSSIGWWEEPVRQHVPCTLLSMRYSKFNKSWFILIYLFLLMKTQNILCDKEALFLEQLRPQRGPKIERRIIGVIGNFLFLISCRSMINEIHQWKWMDCEWPLKPLQITMISYFLGQSHSYSSSLDGLSMELWWSLLFTAN